LHPKDKELIAGMRGAFNLPKDGKNGSVRRKALCRNAVAGKSGLASLPIRVHSRPFVVKKGFFQ